MDWLFLWALLSGNRDRYVLLETTEERAKREMSEAEARARLVAGAITFMRGTGGMIIILSLMWATFPIVFDMLFGGAQCQDSGTLPTFDAFVRFMMRCN